MPVRWAASPESVNTSFGVATARVVRLVDQAGIWRVMNSRSSRLRYRLTVLAGSCRRLEMAAGTAGEAVDAAIRLTRRLMSAGRSISVSWRTSRLTRSLMWRPVDLAL
jgi:hypothetical protein